MIELKPAINEVKLTLKSISSPINLGTVLEPSGGSGSCVPTEVRQAIYTLLDNAAYATTGLEDEIAIVQAWAQEVTALTLEPTSLELNNDTPQVITATTIPSGSTVTWSSSNESVATVVDGVVTGVSNGSCVITATAGNKTANCAVTVSGFATLESISAVYTQSGTVYPTDSLDSLKADLVVTATYSDTSTETIESSYYSLSGTLEVGTSTITVTYQGKTTTFTVTVSSNCIYSIENTSVSTGDMIDSNVKFLNANFSGTVLLDYTITSLPTSGNGSTIAIISVWSDGINGWALRIGKPAASNTAINGRWMGLSNESMGFDSLGANTRHRFAVVHEANSKTIVVHHKKGTGTQKTWTKTASSFTSANGPLRLGSQENGASSLCAGTINKCEVWRTVLSQEELNAFFA